MSRVAEVFDALSAGGQRYVAADEFAMGGRVPDRRDVLWALRWGSRAEPRWQEVSLARGRGGPQPEPAWWGGVFAAGELLAPLWEGGAVGSDCPRPEWRPGSWEEERVEPLSPEGKALRALALALMEEDSYDRCTGVARGLPLPTEQYVSRAWALIVDARTVDWHDE